MKTLFFLLLFFPFLLRAQSHSKLWGQTGDLWTPESRLPDFSFAGYQAGEGSLPEMPVAANVKDFGATGDGETDDTTAILRAIEATEQGAVYFPPGRYIVSDILWIRKSNFVLRGAGPDKTSLFFPKTLEDVRPNMGATSTGKPTSNYSWSGGFLWAKGQIGRRKIATITEEAARGASSVRISPPTSPLQPGQWITLTLKDTPEKTLFTHLYAGDPGDMDNIKPVTLRRVNRVAAYQDGILTLERPLSTEIRVEWNPVVQTFEPSVTGVGIEEMKLEFPVKPYPGHTFTERGMNGIALNNVAHSWVRNVRIHNSDSGIFAHADFCTLEKIRLTSDRPAPRGTTGHHGISFGRDSLLQDFNIDTRFVHDITLGKLAHGNVIKNGSGQDLSLDHHKRGPHANLFTQLDAGRGTRLWKSGGGRSLGKHAAAWNTYWGIRADKPIPYPRNSFAPKLINLVGMHLAFPVRLEPDGIWAEPIPPEKLKPADLHAAQLQRRLEKQTSR